MRSVTTLTDVVETDKINLLWMNSKDFNSEIGYTGHSSTRVLISSLLVTAHRTDSMFPVILILWASGREWVSEWERERKWVSECEREWPWAPLALRVATLTQCTHARTPSHITRSLHCRVALNMNERFVKSKYSVKTVQDVDVQTDDSKLRKSHYTSFNSRRVLGLNVGWELHTNLRHFQTARTHWLRVRMAQHATNAPVDRTNSTCWCPQTKGACFFFTFPFGMILAWLGRESCQ